MRALILFLSLLCGQFAHATGVIIIGDSISSPADAWPQVLRDQCGHHIQLHAQGGRLAQLYEIPPDLRKTPEFQEVVYFLGTNDASAGQFFYPPFIEKFTTHVMTLAAKGFKPIILIPPPYPRFGSDIVAVRNLMIAYCAAAPVPMTCVDTQPFWDYNETINQDEVHPTAALHQLIADAVQSVLQPQSPGC